MACSSPPASVRVFVPLPLPRAPDDATLSVPPWIDTGPLNELAEFESVTVPPVVLATLPLPPRLAVTTPSWSSAEVFRLSVAAGPEDRLRPPAAGC